MMTAMAGTAAASVCTAKAEAGAGTERSGRPTLAIDADGPGRWRVRSWEWRANAWHPVAGVATRTDGGIDVSGPIDATDRAMVVARLGG
ncbi:MAG: hypothetical protein KYX64_00425 [Sphingopyxis sp.]|nr:hypothetical protein [Sphingopyxis sp.]